MAWKEIEPRPMKLDYDVSISRTSVFVNRYSELYKALKNVGFRYNLYFDEEDLKILIVPNSQGKNKFATVGNSGAVLRVTTYAGRIFINALPRGKYRVEEYNFNGKRGFVIDKSLAVLIEYEVGKNGSEI